MITFICGIPCSGKSTYIKKFLPNKKIIDIFEYQQKEFFLTVDILLKCQQDALNDLLQEALKGDVVMEHTLLKKKRRDEQIKFLRDNGYDGEIHLVFLNPPFRELVKRGKERGVDREFIRQHIESVELPTEDEEFTSVTIIDT